MISLMRKTYSFPEQFLDIKKFETYEEVMEKIRQCFFIYGQISFRQGRKKVITNLDECYLI